MQVHLHKTLRIAYISMLDSQNMLDVARVTDSWRGKGPREDFIIFNGKHGTSVAQLLNLFTLNIQGQRYQIAYIRPLCVLQRHKTTGYVELRDDHVRNFIVASLGSTP